MPGVMTMPGPGISPGAAMGWGADIDPWLMMVPGVGIMPGLMMTPGPGIVPGGAVTSWVVVESSVMTTSGVGTLPGVMMIPGPGIVPGGANGLGAGLLLVGVIAAGAVSGVDALPFCDW